MTPTCKIYKTKIQKGEILVMQKIWVENADLYNAALNKITTTHE